MLSNRKKFAVSASLMMATAGIVASVQTAAPATSSSPASARQKAAVTVSIVPGVIGPGGGLQSSKKAKWAVIGKYGTGKVGKKVVLQKQSGSKWVTADKSVVDKKGTVIFAVPTPGSTPVTYRVDGPGSASAPVSTDSWGTEVDFVDEFGGSKLNLADWSYRQSFYEPASKRECSKGDPKAVKVSGGAAKLSVLVDKKRNALCKPKKPGKDVIFGKFKYRLNANIGTQTKHFITYGVVSARIVINSRLETDQELTGATVPAVRDALSNLLLNALQATPAGGRVDVIARHELDQLLIAVEDSGPGIPSTFQQRIWEPFFTTKQRGTGLGLAIVRKRMEEVGGSAKLGQSSNGGGARFELRLHM